MRRLTLLLSVLVLTACATTSGYWAAPHDNVNRTQDHLECLAMAGQAASGAGGWSSSAPVRAAIYDTAKENYYNQCVQSRGYSWIPAR